MVKTPASVPSLACPHAVMSAPGNATGTSKRKQLSPGNHGEVDGSGFSRGGGRAIMGGP